MKKKKIRAIVSNLTQGKQNDGISPLTVAFTHAWLGFIRMGELPKKYKDLTLREKEIHLIISNEIETQREIIAAHNTLKK